MRHLPASWYARASSWILIKMSPCQHDDEHPVHVPCVASATLRDVLKPEDQAWLRERFRVAAHNRYLHLAGACDANAACHGMHGSAGRSVLLLTTMLRLLHILCCTQP